MSSRVEIIEAFTRLADEALQSAPNTEAVDEDIRLVGAALDAQEPLQAEVERLTEVRSRLYDDVANARAEIERLRALMNSGQAQWERHESAIKGQRDEARARLVAVAAAGENVGMADAIRTALEAHTYATEVPDDGEPYIWCLCGWRSDDETNMEGAGRHLFTHLTNAMHEAVRNHLRAALSVDAVAHDAEAVDDRG